MNSVAWDALREEITGKLEIGKALGETELDTMTRLIWLERQTKAEASAASASMLALISPDVYLRINSNDTVDAICGRCFATAATGCCVDDAQERSASHQCPVSPILLVRHRKAAGPQTFNEQKR